MPYIPADPLSIARARLDNAPDGTKLPRSLNRDGTRRLKNEQPVSTEYDTTHSFIRLHGKTFMLHASLERGGNARIKTLTSAEETVPQVVKIGNYPFNLMEVSINRALKRTEGSVARLDGRKHYLPMPFLGDSLFKLLTENRLSDAECRDVAIKLCIEAFRMHHGQPGEMVPLAHLDIKPENITLKDDKLFFIDYGASAIQPGSLQLYLYGTLIYRPQNNAVMTGEMYDMIAIRRTLMMPEAIQCMQGYIRPRHISSLLKWEDVMGTPLEKWVDTSATACSTPESIIERHQPAFVLAAMLIAVFYQLDMDIDTLPANPWLCLLLIELFEHRYTSENMLNTLNRPEAFLREIFRKKFADDTDFLTLKSYYVFERLQIPPTDHVINHCEALFNVAHLPGFLPHLHRLSHPDCAFLLPLLNAPDNPLLIEKIRIILDSVPASDNQWLLYRLNRVTKYTPDALQRVSLAQEKALHIVYARHVSFSGAPVSPLLFIRLAAVDLLPHLNTVRRFPQIHAFLKGDKTHAEFLDGLRYFFKINSEELRDKWLSNINDCPAAWNILFTKDIPAPYETIPPALLRALVYCDKPQFSLSDFRYFVPLILRFPEQNAEMLENTLAFLHTRAPDALHYWVRLIMTAPNPEEGLGYLYFAHSLKDSTVKPEKLWSFLELFTRIEALKPLLTETRLERLNQIGIRFRNRLEKVELSPEKGITGTMQKLFADIHSLLGSIPLKTRRLNPRLKDTCDFLLKSVNKLRPDYQPSYPPGFFRKRRERSEPNQPGLAETRQRLT
ncbi:Protein kinase domain protein [Legionella geestiana]|uniref:Protein kinase domain protein n=1 Tax=Legionella geestiana TaxID=45065 RepID=A0A0W0TPF1_9GAMM|nr:hypothetical protein [Legionella geestiana]KTC97433.1 Protein kinase domain protein [Legionella geestiana]QBS11262.1 hypothetical protein E4T54_00075 [Legionella geestiana]STX54110.1 Protein kinase domain [Legionella geestiana]